MAAGGVPWRKPGSRVRRFVYESEMPQPALERLLLSGELQAFGANRQRMEDAAAKSSKLRVLSYNFLVVVQEIVRPRSTARSMRCARVRSRQSLA